MNEKFGWIIFDGHLLFLAIFRQNSISNSANSAETNSILFSFWRIFQWRYAYTSPSVIALDLLQ